MDANASREGVVMVKRVASTLLFKNSIGGAIQSEEALLELFGTRAL